MAFNRLADSQSKQLAALSVEHGGDTALTVNIGVRCSLERHLELWRKNNQYMGIWILKKKFQDNSDMHLDFKK